MDIGKFFDTVHFIAIFSYPILLYAIPLSILETT